MERTETSAIPLAWAVSGAVESWFAAERHQLVIFAPAALGAGIAAWFVLPSPPYWLAVVLLGIAAAAFGLLAGGLTRAVAISGGLLLALGVILAWHRAESVRAPVLGDRTVSFVTGTVLAVEPQPARGRTRLLVADSAELGEGMTARIGLRGDLPAGVAPGAVVRVRASLTPPPGPNIPGGYHFARRAWFDGIGAVGYALSGVEIVRAAPPLSGAAARFSAFRARLTKRLQDGVGGRPGGLAAALVTGDRGGVEDDVTTAMRDSGLAHLISISGLHIAVIVGGVLWLTRRGLALSPRLALNFNIKTIAAVVAALAGIAYTLVAGAEVPTIRSCIAVLIALVGLIVGREAITLRMVAAGAFLILVVRPEYLLGPSFQLSFAAVTAIVALYQSPLGRRFSVPDRTRGWADRMLRGGAALLATGLVAELALGPIALFHFNQMGLYGMAANLLAIPLTSFVILPLLFIAVVADTLGLGAPLFWLLGQAIGALIALAEATAAVPGSVARLPSMSGGAFGAIILGGLWLCVWQTRRRWIGLAPVAVGLVAMLLAQPPDIIVDSAGRHMAIVGERGIALLRPRAGDYVRSMWQDAAGEEASDDIDSLDDARCTDDSCTARLDRGGRSWTILATRSTTFIDRTAMQPACTAADIVVSDRRLPYWCAPRWLRLDRPKLAETGAVSIWLGAQTLRTVTADDGDHPWAHRTVMPHRLIAGSTRNPS